MKLLGIFKILNFPFMQWKKIILPVDVRMSTLLHVPWSFAYLHYTSYLDNSANDWKIMPRGRSRKFR